MSTEQMRSRLAELYPGPKWRLRVMQMPERQVVAIYKNMSQNGRLKKHPIKKKKEPGIIKAVQMTMFDLPELNSSAT